MDGFNDGFSPIRVAQNDAEVRVVQPLEETKNGHPGYLASQGEGFQPESFASPLKCVLVMNG